MGLFDQGFGGRGGMSPAAIALLGLLAVKGFQNRDKLSEMLGGAAGGNPTGGAQEGGLGGLLGGLGGMLGGGSTHGGNILSDGLGGILGGFQNAGHGDVAQSWVKDGPNQVPAPEQIEQAVGPDLVGQLAKETGLSREELLARLSRELPKAVDQLTPQGRLPSPADLGGNNV
jgi:uncharacterized protein YidB (DUF937 family)